MSIGLNKMATGGALLADDNSKEVTWSLTENGVAKLIKFNCTMPFDWHFKYPHAEDDHNNVCHALNGGHLMRDLGVFICTGSLCDQCICLSVVLCVCSVGKG